MALEQTLSKISLDAGADLSAKQYRFCKINASGLAVAQDATVVAHGLVLQNDPTSGRVASLGFSGVSKVQAGGTVTAGDRVTSDANGDAVIAGSPQAVSLGVAVSSGAVGELIAVFIQVIDSSIV